MSTLHFAAWIYLIILPACTAAYLIGSVVGGIRADRRSERRREHIRSVNRQIRSGALRTETEPPQQIGHP